MSRIHNKPLDLLLYSHFCIGRIKVRRDFTGNFKGYSRFICYFLDGSLNKINYIKNLKAMNNY